MYLEVPEANLEEQEASSAYPEILEASRLYLEVPEADLEM